MAFNDVDLNKLIAVIRKSIIWIVLLLVACNLAAYLYLRWTKPLYQSESQLKLDVKSEANVLNLTSLETQNLNNISGEIELLKSKLFFNRVIDKLNIEVSYFSIGKVLEDERYIHSPFVLSQYTLYNPAFFDRAIHVEILDHMNYKLKYISGLEEITIQGTFGDHVHTDDFLIKLDLRDKFSEDFSQSDFYFVINSREKLLKYLEDNLSVEPLNLNAKTIRISFTDQNPYKARDLVNAIDTIYLAYTKEEKNRANTQRIGYLETQLKEARASLESYERDFELFTIHNKTANPDGDLRAIIQKISELERSKRELRDRLIILENLRMEFDNEGLKYIPTSFIGLLPAKLNAELKHLNTMMADKDILLSTQKENTYAVQRKSQQILILQKQIERHLSEYIENLSREEKEINAHIMQLERQFTMLPAKLNEYSKIKRNYALHEEIYLMLMQRKAELQIAQAGTTTDFKILSSATLPKMPISPQRTLVMGIGAVSGVIFCLLFIGIRYALHRKISSIRELEKGSKAPNLGAIPFYSSEKMPVTKLLVDKKPRSAVSEALRSIRTNIEFMVPGEDKKVISITSTIGGEGKTFVAINLGGIIALSNQKVLIIDLDMRKPRIHMAFSDQEAAAGVSTILIKKDELAACIRKTNLENLDYVPAGPIPPNPSELLLEPTFNKMLENARQLYDIIILDTPPTGLVTDGVLIMKKADLPLYVLRADYSKSVFLENVNRVMRVNRFKNLAMVLNSVKNLNTGYGYGYGYGYNSGYYQDPVDDDTMVNH